MKKLLLVSLLVLTMCIFFAFSVSAQDVPVVNDLGDPSWYTGNYTLIKDKTSQVVLSNGDGTYTAYPAYYVLKYSITVKDGAITEAYVSGFDYSFINDSTGSNYEVGAMYKVELPEGLTTIKGGTFGHNPKEPNVVELVMSDTITSIADHALRQTTNMKKVVMSKNISYIGSHAFYCASGLEEVIFPEGSNDVVDTSKENIFRGCSSLKELDLSKKNIKTFGSNFLSECTNLGKVTLPDSLESIGYCSIYNNPKMYFASDFLPSSLKTAGFHFLSGCKSVNKVLYFPEGFEGFTATYNFSSDKEVAPDITLVFLGKMEGTMNFGMVHPNGGRKMTFIFTKNRFSDISGMVLEAANDGTLAYIGTTADGNYKVQEGTLNIILGNSKDSTGKYKVDENGNTLYYINEKSFKLYFCGGEDVEVCYGIRTSTTGTYNNLCTTPFTFDEAGHMETGVHYDLTEVLSIANCGIDGVTSHTCVLCKRIENEIVPATGDHTRVEVSACADKCEVCLQYVQKAIQSHEFYEYFSYEDGYMCKGAQGSACENEGCSYLTKEEKEALVIDYGYSVPEADGKIGINYGYRVSSAVLSEYERVNGCKIELGILVALGDSIKNDGAVFDHKLVEILNYIDVVVNFGDRTDLNDKEIVIAAVIYNTKDGEATKTYIQGETDKQATSYTSEKYGTLYGISFNSLKAK